ncbi:MAG: hypothetical protein Q9172_006106 [Xanthocarpia lactea]
MLVLQSSRFALCATLFQLCVSAVPASSEVAALSQRDAQRVNKLSMHNDSPKEPWNDHTCRYDHLYDVYLTFTWGYELPGVAMGTIFNFAKRNLQEAIRLHGHFLTDTVVQHRAGLTIKARGFKDHWFNVDQILAAVDLLRLCGFDKGFRNEMWAYIFNAQNRRIAYISIQKDDDQGTLPTE